MITLLTDFGLQDIYVGVMKGIIKIINPDIDIIDLTHNIPPQNIIAASFALASAVDFFPDDTIHLAIVDPTVGSDRKIVAIAFEKGYIICPNNGIITEVLNKYQPQQVYELTNSNYWLNHNPSNTFHGRDIFAPMTAYLSKGIGLETLGHNLNQEDLVILDNIHPIIKEKEIIGSIQYIDTYGNLITNIPSKMLENKSWYVQEGDNKIFPQFTYSNIKKKELLTLIGSHGYVEIAINQGNAKIILNKEYGDFITVKIE